MVAQGLQEGKGQQEGSTCEQGCGLHALFAAHSIDGGTYSHAKQQVCYCAGKGAAL